MHQRQCFEAWPDEAPVPAALTSSGAQPMRANGRALQALNRDRAVLEEPPLSVQRMFRVHFTLGQMLRRREETVRSVVRQAASTLARSRSVN